LQEIRNEISPAIGVTSKPLRRPSFRATPEGEKEDSAAQPSTPNKSPKGALPRPHVVDCQGTTPPHGQKHISKGTGRAFKLFEGRCGENGARHRPNHEMGSGGARRSSSKIDNGVQPPKFAGSYGTRDRGKTCFPWGPVAVGRGNTMVVRIVGRAFAETNNGRRTSFPCGVDKAQQSMGVRFAVEVHGGGICYQWGGARFGPLFKTRPEGFWARYGVSNNPIF